MDEKELIRFIKRAAREGWTELYLRNKGFTSIPAEIGKLTNLTGLYLGGNELRTLPRELRELTNLTNLELNNNGLNSLPAEIWELTNLTSLDLSSNSFTTLPVELWELTNLTVLYLGNNELRSLPLELWEFSNLTSLDLRHNGLTSLPAEIGQLTNLTSLILERNRLTSLPVELWELTKLERLALGGNELISLPAELWELTNLTSLDLRSNGLTSLPAEIGKLTNLTSLILEGNRLTSLPAEIGMLTDIKSLNLDGNRLTSLPGEIWELTNLERLLLGGNELISLPAELWELTNLTSLVLRSNGLTSLPAEIGQLTKLTSLNLERNKLTSLPAEIWELTNIERLAIGGNELTTLPAELWELTNLTRLDLRSNGLASLPVEIGQLTNLTNLSLEGNRLTSLPAELWELTNLARLDLRGNGLTSLPAEIGQLTNLTSLILEGNRITSLPAELWKLTNLTVLDLCGNGLTSLPAEIGQLSRLISLILYRNGLKSLPREITKLKNLKILSLWSNPLESPPRLVANKGINAIRDYFRQLEKEGKDYLYEAKLLIVGEAGAGKTTLAKKLEDPNYELQDDEETTQGINVIEWHFTMEMGRDFRVNIWDFGGQEIYHATHQFFLTKRSLYALVADTRKEDTDFYWWLNVVELLSDNSPILIVKNEKQDRHREINENALRGQFSNIKEILATNLASNRGLSVVEREIKHNISKLPLVGDELPKTWVKVREELEKDKHNYVSLEEYLQFCEQHGFRMKKDKLQLSSYLHDLGVCLHFQDDPVLRKTVILKPEWSTAAVYKLLDDPEVIKNKGRFNKTSLERIWDETRYADMQVELLQLMMNFKLCYKIRDSEDYIAPELMSRNQPRYDWDGDDNLVLRYTYEFMPKGIITQFIVAMNTWIASQDWVWREGVILEKDETRAEVVESYGKREIKICIAGKHKKELMTIIIYELDIINSSYSGLSFSKLIPCNCESCKGNQESHFYSFDILREFVADQQYEIQCQRKPYKMVNVMGLIDDVVDMREVGIQGEPPLSVDETEWTSWDKDSKESDIFLKTEAEECGEKRFKVALSFPGERREFVEAVAGFLTKEFGKEKVFYDRNFEAELARPDLDTYLQEIYHDDSELIVVFLCAEYDKKKWCGLEWRAIRDLIKKRKASVMPVRFDNTHIPGLFSIDGYISVENRKPKEIADRIIERYRINQRESRKV